MNPQNRICVECVSDDHLKQVVINHPAPPPIECSYCSSLAHTCPLEVVVLACEHVIQSAFRLTSNEPAVYLYDRTPIGESLYDLLERLVGGSDTVTEDLEAALKDRWMDYDLRESMYGDDPYFAEGSEYESEISSEWHEMEQSLRHEARLLNPRAAALLETIFGPVCEDRTAGGESVVTEFAPNSTLSSLHRARVFQSDEALECALRHPERFLGPPPEGMGAAGRMNARGVSVFYGSTDKETALGEVRPPVGSKVAIATFTALRPLRLLDLNRLSELAVRPDSSWFAPGAIAMENRHNFLRTLSQVMVMPVMPESQDAGYLTTQAISDFLATHPTLSLDGIIFQSSQSQNEAPNGRNVILFRKASLVQHSESTYAALTANVMLYEEEDEMVRFAPEIFTVENYVPDYRNTYLEDWASPIDPALALDRDSIEVLQVRGVTYAYDTQPVTNSSVQAPRATTARGSDF